MKRNKIEQAGRSMLEMLGVIAIVGILSIGGITGYNKAIIKHRTNKQIEQYTKIITQSLPLLDIKGLPKNSIVNITSFLQNAGIIPEEMTTNDSNLIYDALGNQIFISFDRYFFTMVITGKNNKVDTKTCFNILNFSKELSPIIWQTHFIHQEEDSDSSNFDTRYYGDNYCKEGLGCLRDLNPAKIIELCQTTCLNQSQCFMRILWK